MNSFAYQHKLIPAVDAMVHSSGGEPEKTSSGKLPSSGGGELEKSFSGKLPFRTKPEIHEKIYRAAKKKGMSINAWMEKASMQMAEQELQESLEQPPDSAGLAQQLVQRDPQTFFRLVDRLQKELKPQGIENAIIWMSQVQTLMQDFAGLQGNPELPKVLFSTFLEESIIPVLRSDTSVNPNEKLLTILSVVFQSFAPQGDSIARLNIAARLRLIESLDRLQMQLKTEAIEAFLGVLLEIVKALERQTSN